MLSYRAGGIRSRPQLSEELLHRTMNVAMHIHDNVESITPVLDDSRPPSKADMIFLRQNARNEKRQDVSRGPECARTNGLHHFFWEVGLAHPRSIAGFFSPDDLQRLQFIREHKKSPKEIPINKKIVERAYQHEAIRRRLIPLTQVRLYIVAMPAFQNRRAALAAARADEAVRPAPFE